MEDTWTLKPEAQDELGRVWCYVPRRKDGRPWQLVAAIDYCELRAVGSATLAGPTGIRRLPRVTQRGCLPESPHLPRYVETEPTIIPQEPEPIPDPNPEPIPDPVEPVKPPLEP